MYHKQENVLNQLWMKYSGEENKLKVASHLGFGPATPVSSTSYNWLVMT